MNKSFFEENGGTYSKVGDYFLPNLTLPEESEHPIGIWGQRRLKYLKEHSQVLFTNLLTSGKLNEHLHEIDRTAIERRERIIGQMMAEHGVTGQLKSENQMEWVGKVNNIRACADEIIRNELIHN